MDSIEKQSDLIIFKQVKKIYPQASVAALVDVNFDVKDGEFFVLVGPSGCGKSTVLKIIAGLEDITEGKIQKPQDVSMVFQSGALLPWLTVYENVAFGLKAKKVSPHQAQEQTLKYIEMTGLTEFAQKYPRDLSGGQRQRVGIARALAIKPQVLLLDEPFSALDTATTEELHKDLIKIWQQTKQTIVMVSHSIEEAVTLADRIMLMRNGTVEHIFSITLPRPRREQQELFIRDVQLIRGKFFK